MCKLVGLVCEIHKKLNVIYQVLCLETWFGFPNFLSKLNLHVYSVLVWTPCLMHRCVCIWRYILQNYNYKLHFQNLCIYHILHVFIGTLAAENLDVCTACDLWDSNIQLILISKSWGCPPFEAGHAFLGQRHMCRGGLFISARVFFPYDVIHRWMMEWMDGQITWKSFTKNDHDVLYYM